MGLMLFPVYTLVVLRDWGLMTAHVWEWVVTASLLLMFVCVLCYV